MTTGLSYISVVDPVSPAIDWTKRVLFQPFDLSKWFTIGFCAWLAYLGEGGGSGGNYNFGSHHGQGTRGLEQVKEFVVQNLHWLIPVVAGVGLLLLAIGILFTWLRSRGKFMFLDCVARNRGVIAEPWRTYEAQGNSLFWFSLVLGFGSLLLALPFLGALVASIVWMVSKSQVFGLGILIAVAAFLIFFVLCTATFIIGKLTRDFVVPIMYLRHCKCIDGWREFLQLTSGRRSNIVLYLLFQIVIAIVTGIIVLAVVIGTCCIAGCVLLLPYLGTVLMLPLLVFARAYSALYLAQFGPDWNVFPDEPASAAPQPHSPLAPVP